MYIHTHICVSRFYIYGLCIWNESTGCGGSEVKWNWVAKTDRMPYFYVIFRKRALQLVANLRKETYNKASYESAPPCRLKLPEIKRQDKGG